MLLRSGKEFAPYLLQRISRWKPVAADPIPTNINVQPLLWRAAANEDQCFEQGGDDSEGLGVSSRPASPLTKSETDNDTCGAPEFNTPNRPTPTTTPCSVPIEKQRRNAAAKKRRAKKRAKSAASGHGPHTYAASPPTVKHHAEELPPLNVQIDAGDFPASGSGAWVGKRMKGTKKTPWTVPELLQDGFEVIEWDGRKTLLILDKEGRIIAALVGHPDDPEWKYVIDDATNVMQEVQRLGAAVDLFSDSSLDHRRGEFLAIPVGVSFGGGQTVPGNLVHTRAMRRLIQRIMQSRSIQRIAGFQSSAFAAFAPKLYRYFARVLEALFTKHTHLEHNFPNSIFPAASFNCGPQTISLEHTDFSNLSHGLCALTALGKYDHTLGGHLVLFGLKLAIQFPVGSSALIPSGCLDHGNTPICEGETRLSIAQYAAGGLFRWVSYGFRSAKSLLKMNDGKLLKRQIDKGAGERWREGLAMFSTVSGLQADVEDAFNSVE